MGVYCSFYRLSSEQIADMAQRMERVIHTFDHLGCYVDATNPWLYLLDTGVIEEDDETDGGLSCFIGKSWLSLHSIFTKERTQDVFPANFIYGGTPFIERQFYDQYLIGYWERNGENTPLQFGRWFNPEEVIQIRDFLQAIDTEMTEWERKNLHGLRSFFQEAIERGSCVVTITD